MSYAGVAAYSLTALATSRATLGPTKSTTRKRADCSAMTKEMSTCCAAAAMMATLSMPPGLVANVFLYYWLRASTINANVPEPFFQTLERHGTRWSSGWPPA